MNLRVLPAAGIVVCLLLVWRFVGAGTSASNLVIDRNQLLKEGWEDEGVITGRSLDVYVSKLRKKLEKDPAVSIANIHGKGYRLNSGL